MKMLYPVVVSAVAGLALSVPTAGPAIAEDPVTTLITETIWIGESGVKSGNTLTVGVQEFVQPVPYCSGDACVGTRPARVQIQKTVKKRLRWVTFASGTLNSLQIYSEPAPAIDTRRPAVFKLRTVLPADDTLGQVISPVVTVKVLPATRVTVAPGGLLAFSPESGNWEMTPGEGTVTITVQPATAGRRLIVRSYLEAGQPIISSATTNARGRATVTMTARPGVWYSVELLPTPKLSGWGVTAPAPDVTPNGTSTSGGYRGNHLP